MKIYFQRYLDFLTNRERIMAHKSLERQGASVVDDTKFESYIISNAKTSYWVVTALALLIGYHIIKLIYNILRMVI